MAALPGVNVLYTRIKLPATPSKVLVKLLRRRLLYSPRTTNCWFAPAGRRLEYHTMPAFEPAPSAPAVRVTEEPTRRVFAPTRSESKPAPTMFKMN